MTNKPTIKDSLLLCASDLQHSAIYDNHSEMQSCLRAVADRITALASVIEGVERAALDALKHPAVKSDMLVNGGALKLALNVLRRAGKNEVADELECTAQAGEYQPSSADMVMAALDTEEWGLERMQHWHCLTDEGNREGAWLVKRQKAPYCAVYTDKPGEPYGPRSWSGPTALDALQKAADDLGIHLPQPAARGAAQAAPVDAPVQRESQYNRGFRHGYNRRDAEVKGALA